jgi:hypothetical protein
MSIYQLLAIGLPIIFVAIFSPSGFVFGAVAAVLTMGSVKTLWLVRSHKTRAKHPAIETTPKTCSGAASRFEGRKKPELTEARGC